MAQQQQQTAPGGHYSGHNPIPTVKQFVENLDKDKKERDKKLEESAAARQQAEKEGKTVTPPDLNPTTRAPQKQVKGTEKTVTDPTTGNEVVIADVSKEMLKEVDEPHLVVPNANLNKDTVNKATRGPFKIILTLPAHQN